MTQAEPKTEPPKKASLLRQGLNSLANNVLNHPRRWLWGWILVLLIALPGFLQVKQFLVGGNGGVTQTVRAIRIRVSAGGCGRWIRAANRSGRG